MKKALLLIVAAAALALSVPAAFAKGGDGSGDDKGGNNPAQTSGTVLGRYVKRLPDLSTGLNAFFQRHPDLFMYAALAESAPYIGEQSRLEEWKQRYLTIASSVNETERRRGSRGSKLQTRVA